MLRIFIAFLFIGLLVFFTQATFMPDTFTAWNKGYYLWAKSVDVLFGLALLSRPKDLSIFRPAFIVIVARWAVEILFVFGAFKLNDNKVIGVLFLILVAVCLYMFIKEIKWLKAR